MTPLDNIRELLSQYSREAGMSPLQLDKQNQCALMFDGKYTVNLGVDDEHDLLILTSSLGDLPTNSKENLFETLLEANGFAIPTQGAALGINTEARIITLTRTLSAADLGYLPFVKQLNCFVDKIEEWQKIIQSIKHGGTAPNNHSSKPSNPQSPMTGFRV